MRSIVCAVVLGLMVGLPVTGVARADDVFSEQVEKAQQFYLQKNLPRANAALQQALIIVQDRLGETLSKAMPPPPAGWEANDIETEGLNDLGGGIRVGRSYFRKDGATLGIQIYIDSAPVQEAITAFADIDSAKGQPGVSVVMLDSDPALLRWDQSAKSGEIQLVINNRALVYIEADQIDSEELLVTMIKGFDFNLIRKQVEF